MHTDTTISKQTTSFMTFKHAHYFGLDSNEDEEGDIAFSAAPNH